MLEISTAKIVRVIFLAREYGPDSSQVKDYIASLNYDEKSSLVALLWVGRETYGPHEFDMAKQIAEVEGTAPTEHYLAGNPELPEYLETGMDYLGVDVVGVENVM